jgi:hypothetical protein
LFWIWLGSMPFLKDDLKNLSAKEGAMRIED